MPFARAVACRGREKTENQQSDDDPEMLDEN